MSPEQADGRDVGPPSDIFSLGAVLAFAATGQGPFGTGSTAALVYRVVHSEPDTGALPGRSGRSSSGAWPRIRSTGRRPARSWPKSGPGARR